MGSPKFSKNVINLNFRFGLTDRLRGPLKCLSGEVISENRIKKKNIAILLRNGWTSDRILLQDMNIDVNNEFCFWSVEYYSIKKRARENKILLFEKILVQQIILVFDKSAL